MRVILDDVVNRITGNVDRFNTDLLYYVGGEHYDCGSIAIYNKGILKSEKGSILGFKFHFPFQKGDTLFMARNPHLKKAGMVTYDGITSDASYVLRTKDETVLLPEYLPLVIQNDLFWAFFEANKSGSVNYLMNWKEMKNYEFELPSIDVQKRICAVVWAAEECRKNDTELIEQIEDLVKSQFIEQFGTWQNSPYDVKTLEELCEPIKDGTHKTPTYTDDKEHGYLFLSSKDVTSRYVDWDHPMYIPEELHKELYKRIAPQKGDILLAKNGTTGIAAIVDRDLVFDIYVSLALLRFHPGNNIKFMWAALNMPETKAQFDGNLKGIGVPNLHLGEIKKTKMVVPPTELQDKFALLIEQSDKSKFELKKSVASTEALIKSIITSGLEG